jgi:hypothetical protein
MDEDWVLIQPPSHFQEMIESWLAYEGESVGYCFVCDSPIKSEFDIIPRTNDHRCEQQKAPRRRCRPSSASGSFLTSRGDQPE